ncbi:exopolyphosphatase PRUNE1 [Anopheles nili]|uniref:exopolyphosphatase PRUNE1 n=1 Tax=Anopheles nili TaxID=185578 RepID=UPI00237BFEEC|nr:exopolyphosphatase PRUNE1 [Anopheles nili]
MNNYLLRCRSLFKTAVNKIVVIGNESCDLDSAVCSIAMAFHLQCQPILLGTSHTRDTVVFPVLNVIRDELPLKTEVTFYLKKAGIKLDALICTDEIDWENETTLNIVLVDHHVTKLKQNVLGIFDHRPIDSNSQLNVNAFTTIEIVGSCASLVGREILNNALLEPLEGYCIGMELLYGAIVLDTVNFSKQADKAKPLDYEIAEKFEEKLGINKDNRKKIREELFKSLVAARSDVSELNAYQLLLKDLKIVSQHDQIVSLPGFPMAVQDYIKIPDQSEHFKRFTSNTRSNVVVLLGMKVLPDGSVRRDIGVIPVDNEPLAARIITALQECKETNFELEKLNSSESCGGTFFQQHNLKASRKQLIPVIKNVLSGVEK